MYNFGFEFNYGQNFYSPAYFDWNYPLLYAPCNQIYRTFEIPNSIHYQQQNIQNTQKTDQNQSYKKEKATDQDFSLEKFSQEIEQSNFEKQKKKRKYYGTKNTEANIINQTFSFMNCSNKSRKVLQRMMNGNKKKIDTFYVMIKIVKRNLKKYVNRAYLKSIFEMDRTNLIYKLLIKGVKRLQILPMAEFKVVFRKLVFYYFNNEMVTHILSSNRLSKNTVNQHLKRRRQIMYFIFQQRQTPV